MDTFILLLRPSDNPYKNPGNPHLGRDHGVGNHWVRERGGSR